MAGAALPPDVRVTYRQQYRRCGKATCSRCAPGSPGHGPYWYAYWSEGGRARSRYLGTQAPAGLATAPAAPPDTPPPPPAASPAPLRVRTLGGFAVWRGQEALPVATWTSRRAAALFKCLLSAPGRRLPREQAAEALWPEAEPAAGATNLRTTIHLLRRLLDEPHAATSYVRLDGGMVRLDPGRAGPEEEEWLDTVAFARAARAALAGQDAAACRAALLLYGGDYLPDDPYEAWAAPTREALRLLHLDLLLHLAALAAAQGAAEEAEDCLQRVLAAEPGHEAAAATLMALLAASGRRADALRVYQALATTLEEELDVSPNAEITGLRARLVAQETAPLAASVPPPPRQVPAARLTNLPAPATSFVGRAWEIREVQSMLAAGTSRLVTLVGPGGCGKTRLALEIAALPVESYAEGVWLVELAGLADPALVPRTVAAALDAAEQPGQPLHAALAQFLQPRRVLLVLDNCEHLVGACAELATALLRACAHLQILATSREGLEVAGEQIYRVPSLAAPDPAHLPPLERLEAYEAVALFLQRARARRPDLALTAANAPAVASICARLDGLPLGLELAAARAGVLSIEGIAARLDDRFRLLTGGPRTALPRQQTLRAAIDWSYGLLPEPEQRLLRKLAVFAAGCTLEAAAAVGAVPLPSEQAGEPMPEGASQETAEVLDLLAGLVHKSLLVADERGGQVRYRMLETVRHYALQRLLESGEDEEVRGRHAAYVIALASLAAQGRTAAQPGSWADDVEQEIDNLRAALRWLLDSGQAEKALQLAVSLRWFWEARFHYGEGWRWLDEALARSPQAGDALRARGYSGAGWLAMLSGDHAHGIARAEEALHLFRALGDRGAIAGTLMGIALPAMQHGDYARARRCLEEALTLCREMEWPAGVVGALHLLGEVALDEWAFDEAVACAEESVTLARQHGNRRFLINNLNNLARALLCRGDLLPALPLLAEGLRLSWEWREKRGVAYDLEGFAGAASQQGQAERAARLAGAAHALRQEIASPLSAPEAAICDRLLASARRQLDSAAWTAAWEAGGALTLEQAVEEALPGTTALLPAGGTT